MSVLRPLPGAKGQRTVDSFDGHSAYGSGYVYENGAIVSVLPNQERVNTLTEITAAGSASIDLADGNTVVSVIELAASGTVTYANPTVSQASTVRTGFTLYIVNNSPDPTDLTLAFGSAYIWPSGVTAPTGTTEVGAIIIVDGDSMTIDGTARILVRSVAYVVPPTVTDISPATDVEAGGATITITGTGLLNASGVTFGGDAGTSLTVTDDTELTVVAPAHAAGTVDVVVTATGGTVTVTDGFEYTVAP